MLASARTDRPEPPLPLARLLEEADVRFDGGRPWDVRVHNLDLYDRAMRHGSLGFGESYMDGDWDSDRLDETLTRLLDARLDRKVDSVLRLQFLGHWLKSRLLNRQSRRRAFQVGERHYDIGNDLFEAMLDPTMSYSCGYWGRASNLDEAQQAKLELVADKLALEPGMRVLDIGCGWGGLARYLAAERGVQVRGITVSREQLAYARERCKGLPVSLDLVDYREVDGRYDRVVSVGMFEHVGPKNYRVYFAVVDRVLVPDGLFLLHTIGNHDTVHATDPWTDRYIFPNGKVPSSRQIAAGFEPYFIVEDWHNFGQDYDPTLMAWWHNLEAAWPGLAQRYSPRFKRMFQYYLNGAAAYFRSRQGQLWQLVLSKLTRRKRYLCVR
jgi:cyclopropane-fatty-acyl-phospholipid synthase